ncbi:MAG: cytochrome c peroxidase [Alsobacter sp.]
MTLRGFATRVLQPFLLGVAVSAAILAFWSRLPVCAGGESDPLLAAAQAFRRPAAIPVPAADQPNPARIALGHALFRDTRLSRDGSRSCASCHDPALAFTDGVARGKGIAGTPLARNTPHLWNLAWGETFFWDGRAGSLEAQARGPIENPLEMGQDLEVATRLMAGDEALRRHFAEAFPGESGPAAGQVLRALAAWERTLVSPPTRFDRFAEGDPVALDVRERAGFGLFLGKAGCVSCHSGWAFTDRAYHDVGLPGTDPGRAAIIGLPATEHAFRTPGLRELAWTAPYMHDGSLPSLEAVVDHYAGGMVSRPSLSPDLPRLALTPDEREALVAFLGTLSSEDPPAPASLAAETPVRGPAVATATGRIVSQKDKMFLPGAATLREGEQLVVVNDDGRTHNVRLDGDGVAFDSGAQEPGQTVRIPFAHAGAYRVYCGIHPAMQLTVTVLAR